MALEVVVNKMGRLEITTHIGCPVNCKDCPQKLLRSQYSGKLMMDFNEYKKAIDKVPQNVRIDFSGMCEPFVNPYCADMILYAADQGHPLALYTTLQGATEADYEKIKDIKFEVITIHIPDKNNRSTFNITQEYLNLLSKWNCSAYSCHGELNDIIIPYLLPNKGLITFMHDRAGNVEEQHHQLISVNYPIYCINCGNLLDHNVLLPDGTVIMCCMDYGMTEVFGNLFDQTYDEILNSKNAIEARQKMINKQDCLCRRCTNARKI